MLDYFKLFIKNGLKMHPVHHKSYHRNNDDNISKALNNCLETGAILFLGGIAVTAITAIALKAMNAGLFTMAAGLSVPVTVTTVGALAVIGVIALVVGFAIATLTD